MTRRADGPTARPWRPGSVVVPELKVGPAIREVLYRLSYDPRRADGTRTRNHPLIRRRTPSLRTGHH